MKTKLHSYNLNINIKIILFLFAISRFFVSQFVLCWDTYANGLFILPCKLVTIGMEVVIILLLINSKCDLLLNRTQILTLFVLLLFYIHSSFMGLTSQIDIEIGDIRLILLVLLLFLLKEDYKINIFEYMVKFFATITCPALVYFILKLVGIQLPHSILETNQLMKLIQGFYYEHYPFGLILESSIYGMYRYTGLFDEAGVIGTLCAIFFVAAHKKMNRKWQIILFIEGVFTFSVAFYLLVIGYFLVLTFISKEKNYRKLFILLFVLFIFIIFYFGRFENEYFKFVQNKLLPENGNYLEQRVSDEAYQQIVEPIFNDGAYSLLLGHGKYSRSDILVDMSSYLLIVYDYGIIGFGLFLLIFLLLGCSYGIRKDILPFIVVFMVSIYQRPFVLNFMYITIFICGLSYIRKFETNVANNQSIQKVNKT